MTCNTMQKAAYDEQIKNLEEEKAAAERQNKVTADIDQQIRELREKKDELQKQEDKFHAQMDALTRQRHEQDHKHPPFKFR